MEENFLSAEQVAKILNVSKQTVWIWAKRGKLPAIKMPGSRKWLFSNIDLEKLQKDLKKKELIQKRNWEKLRKNVGKFVTMVNEIVRNAFCSHDILGGLDSRLLIEQEIFLQDRYIYLFFSE